jgi:hypothetical protein
MAFSVVALWPLFVWYVVDQPWRTFTARRRLQPSALPGIGTRDA